MKSRDKRPFLIQSSRAVHFSYIRSFNFYLFFLALSAKNVAEFAIIIYELLEITSAIQNKYWITSSHLAVHVHDDHRAGVVANQKLFWILREGNHVVDGHLRCSRQRLVSVQALPGFRIPNLQCDIKKYHTSTLKHRSCGRDGDTRSSFPPRTFTVPSADALMMWRPSAVKNASLTNDRCPVSSFIVFPDLSSCILRSTVKAVHGSHTNGTVHTCSGSEVNMRDTLCTFWVHEGQWLLFHAGNNQGN